MGTYAEAKRDCKALADFWRLHVEFSQAPEYGRVHARPVRLGLVDGVEEWGIRSNLVNGLPPRRKGCECRLPR